MRNIEIKSRLLNRSHTLEILKQIADAPPEIQFQCDTFFRVAEGRLKLREIRTSPTQESVSGVLVFYHRPDQKGPKLCNYQLSPVNDCQSMLALLSTALGVLGQVRKQRLVFIVGGRTRVHVDQVEHLGDFLELEVVLEEEEAAGVGEEVAHQLMLQLGVRTEDLLDGAYMDLILDKLQS